MSNSLGREIAYGLDRLEGKSRCAILTLSTDEFISSVGLDGTIVLTISISAMRPLKKSTQSAGILLRFPGTMIFWKSGGKDDQ